MLTSLKSLLSEHILSERSSESGEGALHKATAALLLEVSYADFEVQDEELAVIADALRNHFGFSAEETHELLEAASEKQEDTLSLHGFVRLINDNFSAAQKGRMIEDMWRIAYADQRLDKYEEYRIRKIADLLYVPHSEFIRTKLRVQESLDDSDSQ